MGEKWKNLPFLGRTHTLVPVLKVGTGTHGQRQSGTGTGTDQSGTGTHSQKRVGTGTGTDQSGTGTDASRNPHFCTLALLSPKSVHR